MKPTSKTWILLGLAVLGFLAILDARVNAVASSTREDGLTFDVSEPVSAVLSQAVRDMVPAKPEAILSRETNPIRWLGEGVGQSGTPIGVDSLSTRSVNGGTTPLPLVTFEGVPSLSSVTPPDTNGDVGPNHYVQMTNFHFQIWDKGDPNNGVPPSPLISPMLVGDLFTEMGGQCADNFGDPIVLYDDMADRWLLSQFAFNNQFAMCFAISTTPDPTGTYYLYEIGMPEDFPDYPKLGVWPDAYYMGTNSGYPNAYYAHAFDRVSMLAGEPATRQSFGGLANLLMPADVDGTTAPPNGDPGIFYTFYHPDGEGHPAGTERLAMYEFDVDWETPGDSTFTLADELPLTPFNYTVCGFFASCIPQPGTSQLLDDISFWPMFRFQYRNFGGYAAMVGNFTVDPDDTDRGAIRWFEARKTGSDYSLYQEGTYDPDTDSRWMGSIAMDISGNIALGYSVSSDSTIPSIRYATRLAGDPLGTLSPEAEMWAGGGVQTGIWRWGDYSAMVVDPVDGCTFWYTTEYHDTDDEGFGWNTRIGVFRIPTCGGPHGTLTGQVTDSATTLGIPNVHLQATASITKTGSAFTNASGFYTTTLLEGTYVVTATVYGYYPDSITGVDIISGTTTTLNFQLDPAPNFTVDGTVTDANTGWPLYAEIDITGYPGDPIWTDPLTGQYSIELAGGSTYTFEVTPWTEGYEAETRTLGPLAGNQTEDFALLADLAACIVPGYVPDFFFYADFENSDGGFTADGTNATWEWGHPTNGPGGAHSGQNAWATNLSGNYNDNESSHITSPDIDLSAFTGQTVIVSWWQWLQTEGGFDYASVEVSNDGGTSWSTVYGPIDGFVDSTWTKYTIYLDPSYAVSNFRVRFVLETDSSVVLPGFYVDDVGVGVVTPPPNLYAEDFEASDGSYITSGVTSWEWGTPTRGPDGAHSGVNVWGTNLDDNYGNNEDGYITSPVIDLSGGVGETMLLSWWQWLQTENNYDFASVEVTNNGITWTQVYTASGIVTTDWVQEYVELDPGYATPDFQTRFRLQTDSTVTYPGFYVDDVRVDIFVPGPPAVDCEPQSGGLLLGYVSDANIGTFLNGAIVSGSADSTTSQATPFDPAVEDGFYTLFAFPGTQPVTATLSGGYGPDIQNPTVILGGAVQQDFSLPAGLLSANPDSLSVTLDMGATDTQTFDLSNLGGMAAFYDVQERDNGFLPAAWVSTLGSGYQSEGNTTQAPAGYASALTRTSFNNPDGDDLVCVFKDLDPWGTTEVETFLAANGISYAVYTSSDFASLDFSGCQSIVFSSDQPQSFYDEYALYVDKFEEYVEGGGFLNFFSADAGWNFGFLNAPLPGGMTWNPYYSDVNEIDDPTHPVVQGVPSPFYGNLASHGNFSDLPAEAHVIAHDTYTGEPTIVEYPLGAGWVIAFGQPLEFSHAFGLELGLIMENTLLWGLTYAPPNVPWLDTAPISGTLATSASQTFTVTFDAGVPEVTQPGAYFAELRVKNDTPYGTLIVPVTMNVNPPSGWGKLTGTVMGLAACDAPGAPLDGADVDISGVAITQSDDGGQYTYWMSAGSYEVTVSASGYVSQTFTANITDGSIVIQDVDLRLDTPCASPSVSSLNLSVGQGTTATTVLSLNNSGAGDLTYNYFESVLDLGQVSAPALQGALTGSMEAASGPASVQTLALSTTPGQDAPLSGWFSAVDHPEGIIRYASAQCYEQPDSYYVMSGIDGQNFNVSTSLWRFDATNNSWTQLADNPSGHEAPVAACYQGRIYLMGGDGTDEMYVYDINQDSWNLGASLPREVEGAAAAAWDGKVYLIGGDNDFQPSSGVSDEVNIYDIATDTWIGTGAPMPTAAGNAGFAQVGTYVYVVGGWGEIAPTANITATLRYDLDNDAWESGPTFDSARADFALAATDGALYAIGGDDDGGFFFEAVATVERLDLTTWPLTSWTDPNDPIPVALQANNAGFCTQALFDPTTPEVWSVGGLDTNFFFITGRTLFQEQASESCYSIYTDVPWLSVDLPSGTVSGGINTPLMVSVDATNLLPGQYTATIVIVTNDPENPQFVIPVTVTVTSQTTFEIFLPVIQK